MYWNYSKQSSQIGDQQYCDGYFSLQWVFSGVQLDKLVGCNGIEAHLHKTQSAADSKMDYQPSMRIPTWM